jgi:hypothetical protein
MSEYTAIRAVSNSLRQMLEDQITDPPGVNVVLKSPKEMAIPKQTHGISVWLYRVTRNEHALNQPPERVAANQLRQQPIPVNLHYLITPIMSIPGDEHTLLGRVLQVLNDHPVLRGGDLKGDLEGGDEAFRIHLETLSLEELTRIWSSLQESYQASLSYLVQMVSIDSEQPPLIAAPVKKRETTYSQILSSR